MKVTLRTWPEALEGVLYPARAAAVAMGVMGLFAVMLAVTGIFGTAAHSVSRRVRELGIRMALGAREAQVWLRRSGDLRPCSGLDRRWACWQESSRTASWGGSSIRRIRAIRPC